MTWQEAYDDACQRFGGQRPGNALEQELIEAYEARPVAFQHAVDKLAQRYADGKVRSPWPLVKAELEQDAQRALIVGDDSAERELQIHLAERFIANAGWGLPTEAELVDELFGRHGKLRAWAGDEPLVNRMVDAWRRARTVPAIEWPQRTSG